MPTISDLTRQRLAAFKSRRISYASLIVLAGLFGLSLFSEFLANNVPIALRYEGRWYFPVFTNYSPALFGQRDTFVVDYRLVRAGLRADDIALWPPIFWGPFESDSSLKGYPAPPSGAHWLGSDDKGRDLLTRLIYGFRISMIFALSVWVFSFTIGVVFGALQGFFGGRVDFYGQRFSEIWSAVPVFFLILTLIVIFSPSLILLIVLFTLFGWPSIAQYERAEFLRLRRLEFVEAARALGASPVRIMFRHLLPNALIPVVTFTPFTIAGAITGIAALDYLGFGVPPPTPSWGELLRQALSHFTTSWWIATYTVGAMFFTLLLLVFINEGVREAFDPHRRRG
ncbi:MAG: ABC transporter permease subunit [SAR324 cluster bacterium]|nr:ABC transporter permease subunit [SAR324 cluster bacterium]